MSYKRSFSAKAPPGGHNWKIVARSAMKNTWQKSHHQKQAHFKATHTSPFVSPTSFPTTINYNGKSLLRLSESPMIDLFLWRFMLKICFYYFLNVINDVHFKFLMHYHCTGQKSDKINVLMYRGR